MDDMTTPDERVVAVAYGRDDEAREAMFAFLRALGLNPLEWEAAIAETGSAMPYSGDAVERAFARAQAVICLFTPDDEVLLHPELGDAPAPEMQPRPNVLLETGMALATHPAQTVIVELGQVREITNLSGRNTIRIGTDPTAALNALASRLQNAGCAVSRTGGDWLNVPRFTNLAAFRRRAHGAPKPRLSGQLAEDEEDDLSLEVDAAASRAGVNLTQRQKPILVELLRTYEGPFHTFDIATRLPAPTLAGGEINRLLTELHLRGVLPRVPEGQQGYLRYEHPEGRHR
jgi:hypothetical protein